MIYDFYLLYIVLSCKMVSGDVEMYTNEFEEAFSNFLDRHEYDEAENYLFSMVRLAFAAGWQAAGGAPPQAERIFELIVPERERKKNPAEAWRLRRVFHILLRLWGKTAYSPSSSSFLVHTMFSSSNCL